MSDRCIRCKQSKYGIPLSRANAHILPHMTAGRTVCISSQFRKLGRGREGRDRNKSCLLSRGNVDSSVFRVATTTRKEGSEGQLMSKRRKGKRESGACDERRERVHRKERVGENKNVRAQWLVPTDKRVEAVCVLALTVNIAVGTLR